MLSFIHASCLFVVTKKYGSARTVFMDLPEDTIPCLSEGKKEVEIPSEILKAIDEYMSLKAYFVSYLFKGPEIA